MPPRSPLRRALALSALVFVWCRAEAQPELKSLLPATAPAFILLDAEPSAVPPPATPADFAASLIDSGNTLSSVPEDFAIEVSPYWLVADPRTSWRDDVERDVGESLVRTFAVSAATARSGTAEAATTGLAVGISFGLRSGRVPQGIRDTLETLEQTLRDQAALLQRFRRPRLAAMDAEHAAELRRIAAQGAADEAAALATARATVPPERLPAAEAEIRAALGQRLADELQAAAEAHGARVAALDAAIAADPAYRAEHDRLAERAELLAEGATLRREGLHIQLSGGSAWQFADGRWDAGAFDRLGVWGTLSYEGLLAVTETATLTPIGVVRYLSAEAPDAEEKLGLLDLGGRFMLAGARYSLSVEGVMRTAPAEDAFERQYRIAGVADYEVRPDLWLRASFGRDYETEREGSLIAQLGLTFALTEDRYAPIGD